MPASVETSVTETRIADPPADIESCGAGRPWTSTVDADPANDVGTGPSKRVLGGRYVVLGMLGRGAMGIVHRAYDQAVGREVAVKVLQTNNPEAQERLIEEARAMAKLSDPHVVAVYDIVPVDPVESRQQQGRVLLAMQYVRGQTLRAWLEEERTPQAVLEVFCQAGRGLLAAHRAGIVHRDFKPTNVLVAEDGHAYVTDFGIAGGWCLPATSERGGEQTATVQGRSVGTPWYMPPEQHLGLSVDPRADQYAFCVSLWEALAGQLLFPDSADAESLLARKYESLAPWPKPDILPAKMLDAIYRGLSVNPEDRFPSMEELLAALAAPDRSWHRSAAAAGLACVPLIAAAFTWSWYLGQAQKCSGAGGHLTGVWDEARREAVRASLVATAVPYAADTAIRIERDLDAYADAWTRGYRSACEATTLRGEQPADVMDLRMACLHEAKLALQAATNLLVDADARVVEKAQQVVGNLPTLERCANVEALGESLQPPNPRDAPAVEEIRVELARVNVLIEAGKYVEAEETALRLADRGRTIDYPPLHTEIWLALGVVHKGNGFYAASETALKQALRSGLRLGQRHQAQSAAKWLVSVVGGSQMRASDGLGYAATAQGLLAPGDAKSAGDLHVSIGNAYLVQERHEEAEAQYMAALERLEEVLGPSHISLTLVRNNLAVTFANAGRYVDAEREHRRVLTLREEALGKHHPQVAVSRINLGMALVGQHRYEDAQREYRAALTLLSSAVGPEHPLIAKCRHNLAAVARFRGDLPLAESEGRAALELLLGLHGPEHPDVAQARHSLAHVLTSLGRHQQAEEEHRTALALRRKLLGAAHPSVGDSLRDLGATLQADGRHVEAEAVHREALAVLQQALGSEHPDVAQTRHQLARALFDQGLVKEAEAQYLEALAVQRRMLGPEHPSTATTREALDRMKMAAENMRLAHMR